MIFGDSKGIRYGRYAANELLATGDLNAMASYVYENLTGSVAALAEALVGVANTVGTAGNAPRDLLLNGLAVSISGTSILVSPGMVVSYRGSYFNPSTGAFAFQTGTVGQPFLAILPAQGNIANFATSPNVIAGREVRANIEIRPRVTVYKNESRSFIDPATNVVSNSTIDTRGHFDAQLRLRYGTSVAANSQAPALANGWVKIGELFIDTAGTASIVSPASSWQSNGSTFLSLADFTGGISLSDIPSASTTVEGLVERATDSESMTGTDTTRYTTPAQVAARISAAISALNMTITQTINNLALGIQLTDIPDASATTKGLVELATSTEVAALSDSGRAVTPGTLPDASETQKGLVERATDTEATTGTDTTRFVNPKQLKAATSPPDASRTVKGLVELATPTEANALSDVVRAITPGTVPKATTSQQGISELATNSEAAAGADASKVITAASLRHAADARYRRKAHRTVTVTIPEAGNDTRTWAQIHALLTADSDLAGLPDFYKATCVGTLMYRPSLLFNIFNQWDVDFFYLSVSGGTVTIDGTLSGGQDYGLNFSSTNNAACPQQPHGSIVIGVP